LTSPISRPRGVELAAGEEHLLGVRRADEVDERLRAVEPVAEAELGRRHAELRALGADADVAAHRRRRAAADAVAADHRDRRDRHRLQRRIGLLRRRLVVGEGRGLLALVLELRDVGARRERLAARAGDDHDADRRIGGERRHDLERGLPHLERDRVVALGVVEDHPADAAIDAGDHFFAGHGCFLR
jgi:hypothetical protein